MLAAEEEEEERGSVRAARTMGVVLWAQVMKTCVGRWVGGWWGGGLGGCEKGRTLDRTGSMYLARICLPKKLW